VYYDPMMVGILRMAAKSAFSLWLVASLMLAPALAAHADCLPDRAPAHKSMSHGDHAMAHGEQAPCDTPCGHCDGDDNQAPCKGHCAGVTVSIAPTFASFNPHVSTTRVVALRKFSLPSFARPPDTPPPRTFLV
jgi:hypothetical protein